MAEDLMRYDLLAQSALRGVVREALRRVRESGLPGEHHFYIAFRTNAPGVQISSRLRARYPQEMTIVLQHQFWDLTIDETKFQVRLSFNNIAETLIVPFSAIKGFFDPSVQFGLQFEPPEHDEQAVETVQPAASAEAVPTIGGKIMPSSGDAVAGDEPGNDDAEALPVAEGADILRLDAFRKKS